MLTPIHTKFINCLVLIQLRSMRRVVVVVCGLETLVLLSRTHEIFITEVALDLSSSVLLLLGEICNSIYVV